MSNAEDRFIEKLAEITGNARTPRPAEKTAQAEEPQAEKIATVADMSIESIIDHPAFFQGFEDRLAERMPEIEASVNAILE
jgi:hypothetical protein